MNTRRYPRTMREAFHEWPECALGINDPIEVGPRPWWVRLRKSLREAWRYSRWWLRNLRSPLRHWNPWQE